MATLVELKMRKMELRDKMDEERKAGKGISEEIGLEYGQLIDRLQEGERKLHKHLVWPTLLCLLLLIIAGCRTTILGTGQAAQGIGKGIGTIIVGTGDFLVDEMNGNEE